MKIFAASLAAVVLFTACSQETRTTTTEVAKNTTEKVKEKVGDAFDVAVPIGQREDPAAREKERFDEQWRQLQSFRAQEAAKARAAAVTAAQNAKPIQFVANAKETLKGATAEAINAAPVSVPLSGDVTGASVIKTQVYLDRADFSVGALDGRWGKNTGISLWWFQRSHGLEATGALDEPTFRALSAVAGGVDALTRHTLTADDVKGPFVTLPEDVYEKEKLDCLCYESLGEKLAERFHTTTDLLALLNGGSDLNALTEGAQIWVPNVREQQAAPAKDVTKIVVSIAGNTFNAFDGAGQLVFHAPTTLGSKFDPSPNETVKVVRAVENPHFHYQPTLFHEVPDSDPEANLQPGPNSPVGVVWVALSKPHFGIHGTADPDSIGYASSHGCVRLTNWDALELSRRLTEGVSVEFVDTRKASAE
jgi:lipoprotein-anchoring transpeptidase ErfK/SrfK